MPGLRFFACETCGAVSASPDRPPGCGDCGGDRFADITDSLQDGAYFAPPEQ